MANYKLLIPHIKRWEGGFSNDPDDRGGATMCGVTLETYKAYCRRKGAPVPTVSRLVAITEEEWEEIFKTMYWDKCRGDEIESQSVANVLVDWYWGSGRWAITNAQRVLGAVVDGVVGEETLRALNRKPYRNTFATLQVVRKDYYLRLVASRPTQKKFLRGWLNRMNALHYVD